MSEMVKARCDAVWFCAGDRAQCRLDLGHEGPHSVPIPHQGMWLAGAPRVAVREDLQTILEAADMAAEENLGPDETVEVTAGELMTLAAAYRAAIERGGGK